MEPIPDTMRALVVPRVGGPAVYEVEEVPVPRITDPKQVLIRIHALGVNTGELQMYAGQMNIIHKPDFPAIVGMEGAGTVVAVGAEASSFRVGDAVYGNVVDKPMFRTSPPGFGAQYAVAEERFLLPKPPHVSFEEAASLPGFVVTAYQAIRRGLQLQGRDSLEGQTVFVPAGLSGTGSVGIQVARNVFGAARIVTTVSTPKVPLVESRLPCRVDQVVDYQTQRLQDHVPPGSVDFMYNTQWDSLDQGLPVLNRRTGVVASISSLPSKETTREIMGADRFPWWLGVLLDLGQLYYSWKLRGTSICHEMISGGPQIREDLEKAGEIIARGQVKAVITVVSLDDMDAVREGLDKVMQSKGGLGKLVIQIP